MEVENKEWAALSYAEKNHELFLKQKALLDSFLEHGAISQAQHDKSLYDPSWVDEAEGLSALLDDEW